MSPFIETMKLVDGELQNLQYHQQRFERTRFHAFGLRNHPKLKQVIQIPDGLNRGVLRCRMVYETNVIRIEYQPHEPRRVGSLKTVVSDSISYDFKSANRKALEMLFELRGPCDDILIVKNGCITDSSYANVVFGNEDGWVTPDTPLLPGTMRASLLDSETIKVNRITLDDLDKFQTIRLINALNNLHDGSEIPIDAVIF